MVAMPAAVGGLPNKRPVQGSMYVLLSFSQVRPGYNV